MARTIWKTILTATDVQDVELPASAEILCARDQHEELCIWYRRDPTAIKTKRRIAIVGTGHGAPEEHKGRYLGTGFLRGGQLVFHVFEEIAVAPMP